MPRQYKRKIGSRNYMNYTKEKLEQALEEIRNEKLSLRQAAEKYSIHRNTLWLKLKGKHSKKPGQQKVFTDQEENVFVAHLITTSTFGFPVTTSDLRFVVKSYLDRQGKKIKCFNKNMPGTDWVKSFLNRHPQLSQRIAQNISHSRAATDEDIINNFFNHLEVELDGIPPSNIFNFDETNLVDDPGLAKIITKRGTKYPERIRNSSKACTSLMVCGNAEGQLAPLYVNYKSQKLWSTWTENGPPYARYNRTSSGWFDYQVFEDWFLNLLLPLLKKLDGPKAIIGDNLSSHLNLQVVKECEANNIRFIALPPNTTHLLQPLDVAFFRPMKEKWRKLLSEWKETAHGSRFTSVPKDEFPCLLKLLMAKLEEKGAENLKSGFRKTGIFPLNRQVVLDRLCSRIIAADTEIAEVVSASFIEHLSKTRADATRVRQIRRKKKLNVPAGSSNDFNMITAANNGNTVENQNADNLTVTNFDNSQPSCSGTNTQRKKQKKPDESSEESEDEVKYQESDESPWDEHFSSDEDCINQEPDSFKAVEKIVGEYVVVDFEGKYFPGQITNISEEGASVNVMTSAGQQWKWPQKRDEIFYQNNELVMTINIPKQRGKRALFDVPELSNLPI